MDISKQEELKSCNKKISVTIDDSIKNHITNFGYTFSSNNNTVIIPINIYDFILTVSILLTKHKNTKRIKIDDKLYLEEYLKSGDDLLFDKSNDSEIQTDISEEFGVGISIELTKHFFNVQPSSISKIKRSNYKTMDFDCHFGDNKLIKIESKGTTSESTRRKQIKDGLIKKDKSVADVKIISATLLNEESISECAYMDPPIIPVGDPQYLIQIMRSDHYSRVFNLLGQSELSEYFSLMKKRIKQDRAFNGINRKDELYNKLRNKRINFNYLENIIIGNVYIVGENIYQFFGFDERLLSVGSFLDFQDYDTEKNIEFGTNNFIIMRDGVCVGYINNVNDLPNGLKEQINLGIANGEIRHYQEYTSILDIDTMSELSVKNYLKYVFLKSNFKIMEEFNGHNLIYDFLISKNNKKYAIEIKTNILINIKKIEDSYSLYRRSVDGVIIVTNKKIPDNGAEKLRNKGIIILDRDVLKKIIKTPGMFEKYCNI